MQHERLPDRRNGATRRFAINYIDEIHGDPRALKFYATTGEYPDGRLGEVFIRGDKIGGFISGALDALAMTISVSLQHGVPMRALTDKLRHNRFGPAGWTGDETFKSCTSMFDLVAQWLEYEYPDGRRRANTPAQTDASEPKQEP